MNTLRKLQKSIENVETELDKCFIVDGTEDISTLIRKLERIEVIHSEIESGMKAEFNKITEKMDQRDPITNEARFGPSTKEKIISFGNSFLILEDRIKVIHLKIVNCINQLPPVKDTPESADDEVIYLQQLTTDEEIEKKQFLEQQIQAQTEQENQIREKARILREKKATELKQSALLLQALTETLQLYISELNTLLSCTDADMEMRIQTFTQSLLCAGKNRECEDALKTIADILERIIRRPDDAPGRRLRVTHPVLQSKLTGISGGIELLISCGFQAIALIVEQVATNNAAPSASSSVSDKLQLDLDHFASSTGSAVERGLFAMLHPHSEWTLTLVMEEPQIDALLPPAPTAALALNPSESSKLVASIPAKLDWISWFDGLERNLKLFKRTIATIQ